VSLQEEEEQRRQAMEHMTQLVERMCNQNVQHEIISDFKACPAHFFAASLPTVAITSGEEREKEVQTYGSPAL